MLDLGKVARAKLDDPETGWNMGSFGAIAEFHHVAGDPPAIWQGDLLRAPTAAAFAYTSPKESARLPMKR